MTSMREKLARAIGSCGKLPKEEEQRVWAGFCRDQPKIAELFRVQAQAVLDALQDPTDAMIDAGHQGFHQVGGKLVAPKPKVMFKAMIKAAGEEGT